MAELKHNPIRHDHETFLAKARLRKGFSEAYDALDLEYQVADQLLKARARAGLTQDAVDRAESQRVIQRFEPDR